MLKVGGLTPCTTIDYPGELAAVIFCQGCPWRCCYCHNRHLLAEEGERAIPWHAVLRFLQRRRGLLDAVVFSGGEPTLQTDLVKAARTMKKMGFKVGLHTSGAFPETLRSVLPLLDWIGMDIKAPFAEYARITGVPGSGALARMSAERVRASGVAHQFRSTLAPFLLEDGRIDRLRRMVAEEWGSDLVLQQMHLHGTALNQVAPGTHS
jgi:pyruvate formate lyase activating enzyme